MEIRSTYKSCISIFIINYNIDNSQYIITKIIMYYNLHILGLFVWQKRTSPAFF